MGKITRGFILEEVDIDAIEEFTVELLQVAIWALANHPHSIEKELGISTQYRKRLEAIVVKMYVPEMPEGQFLN